MYHDLLISISVEEFFKTELFGKILWFKFSWREEGRVMEREGGGKEEERRGGRREFKKGGRER